MKVRAAVVAGCGALALGGTLTGMEAVARTARVEPATPARATMSTEEAVERLMLLARRGGERREFQELLRTAGAAAPKEELLAIAAGARRTEAMEWLLFAGALPGGGRRPAAPLLAAAAAGDASGVRLLLSAGAAPDPDLPEPGRRLHPTPLVAAICSGSLDCADALIAGGADPRRPIEVAGFTLDAVRRPPVLRTTPREARRLRTTTALELARLSPNPLMPLVVGGRRPNTTKAPPSPAEPVHRARP